MKKLLTIKHWQYFLLFIGPPIILQALTAGLLKDDSDFTVMNFISLGLMGIYTWLFFGWFYFLGKGLYEKLSPTPGLNLRWFKFFIFLPVLLIVIFMTLAIIALVAPPLSKPLPKETVLLIIPYLLLLTGSYIYIIFFVSKALKSFELKREALFGEYIGELALAWFFIVGFWVLQPRVNKIFDTSLLSQPLSDTHSDQTS